ncbi:hypothetical protein [Streptomyces spirodelae]|uniref:Uncharacterized protein n=1 Tax=Streptomyces spirodelae TaxID=2812904 RepID=A0ABS3WM50_9ACTN|nr:hypothetical protein [Streptomyces spirodelae]MBO8184199.1 hypothetical protein [Streptomyces spirodelae]
MSGRQTGRQATRELVRRWAESVLRQVGAPSGATLAVSERPGDGNVEPPEDRGGGAGVESAFESSLELVWDEEGGALPAGGAEAAEETMAGPGRARIEATLSFADGSAVSVELDAGTSETDAVVLLADRFQDAVLEETGGVAGPPCPGHGHPAVAAELNGVATWTCPHGMGRTTWPVLQPAVDWDDDSLD